MSVSTAGEILDLNFNIRALRIKNGWTQRELANRIGTSHPNVNRYEQPGYQSMSLNTLEKLAEVFGVSMADLLSAPRANYTPNKYTYARFTPAQEVGNEKI